MIAKRMFRTSRISSRAGTAYVEYFLAALAFTLAAVWLFQGGLFQGVKGALDAQFAQDMADIKR